MGIRDHIYDCIALQEAWNYKNDTQATQGWDPWELKLKRLIGRWGVRRAIHLCLELDQELENEHFARVELDRRIAMQTGRADRPVPATRPVSARAVRP